MGSFDQLVAMQDTMSRKLVCGVTSETKAQQIIDVVKNHLAENPEDWRNTAASIVGFAIMRAFPCGKYNGRREAAARGALWATRKRAKFCPAIFAKAPHRYSREPGCRAGIHGTYGDKAKPPRLTPSAVLLFVRRTRVAQ
jgi:hypothetical protein